MINTKRKIKAVQTVQKMIRRTCSVLITASEGNEDSFFGGTVTICLEKRFAFFFRLGFKVVSDNLSTHASKVNV